MGANQNTVIACSISAVLGGLSAYWYCRRYKSNESTHQLRQQYMLPDELRNCSYIKEIQVAIELSLECGNRMYQYCDTKGTANELYLDINTKGQPEDFCTQIDIENEDTVMNRIRQEFPRHSIIGEETVGSGPIPSLSSTTPTWIIDPIDGTTNFASGIPLTCVSIGHCVNGIPVLGVVYAPMTSELYIGVSGHGAYRNGIQLTSRFDPNKKLKESVVCFEFGYTRDFNGIDLMVNVVRKIMKNGCRTTRSLGSGVLDMIYVATGRIDVVYTGIAGEGWKPWDYCAGTVIAQECNCTIQSIDQQDSTIPFNIYSKSMICAVNESLVSETRTMINDARQDSKYVEL
jgi:fructose-1,6-bisphosphatase/inositol monophosphatase family enzyme